MEISSTELARNIKQILDRVEHRGEEVVIIRNNHRIARLIPGTTHMTALEAMADLFATLSPDAAQDWLQDSRTLPGDDLSQLKNPWDT